MLSALFLSANRIKTAKFAIFSFVFFAIFFTLPSFAKAATPVINPIANTSSATGVTYTATPTLLAGENVRWTKEYGPDDMTVDPTTGAVSWAIPNDLPREAFHLGVKATNADGATYITWILKVGGGNFIYCGIGEDAARDTISECTALASSGDTIVVRDGTYIGAVNMMQNNLSGGQGTMPPSGSVGIYTTVMSEHPGGALIDGEGLRAPIYWNGNYDSRDGHMHNDYDTSYIAVKGFVIGRSNYTGPLFMNHVHHIKVVDVGGYDQAMNDSGAIISFARSGYILIEGCYVWGNGREGITIYITDYGIMRRNVVRNDRTNSNEPLGGIVNYASQYARTQSSIVIDSDQPDYYTYSYLAGAFDDSSGGARYEEWGKIIDVKTVSSIALNIDNAFTVNVQNDNGSEASTFENVIGWNIRPMCADADYGGCPPYPVINAPGDMNISQSTFGHLRSPYGSIGGGTFISGWAGTQNMTNSIIYDVLDYGDVPGGIFSGWENSNFNNIFNTGTLNVNNSVLTNTISSDPTSACLKYLPRIESDCPLQTAGLSGARVGANILYMRGKSGTLWGETGYDSESATTMWPFPHEDLIKQKMAAYSYDSGNLTGARGFATGTSMDGSPQTLTKYIWEYLGNQIPCDIYGTCSGDTTAPNAPAGLSVS